MKNFDEHMVSGKVVCALVESMVPGSLPLDKVSDNSKQMYVAKAFEVARGELNVAPLMGARALCEKPDAALVQRSRRHAHLHTLTLTLTLKLTLPTSRYVQRIMDRDLGAGYRDPQESDFRQQAGYTPHL